MEQDSDRLPGEPPESRSPPLMPWIQARSHLLIAIFPPGDLASLYKVGAAMVPLEKAKRQEGSVCLTYTQPRACR